MVTNQVETDVRLSFFSVMTSIAKRPRIPYDAIELALQVGRSLKFGLLLAIAGTAESSKYGS